MEENPAAEMPQQSSSSRRVRRDKRRQKSRLSQAVLSNDINAKGFIFETEIMCNLKCKIGERWPRNHILSRKPDTNASLVLIEEIKSINVGVNLSLDCCALTKLKTILAKLALRHSTAPFKYIAWHYAFKVRCRRITRSQSSDFYPELTIRDVGQCDVSSEESLLSAVEKDSVTLLLENTDNLGGGGDNGSRVLQNNMNESVHPNVILLFLLSCIRQTVPDDIFGCRSNKKIFIKRWLPVLYGFPGRKSVALGRLMNGVNISKISWACEVGSIGGRGKKACVVSKVWLWLLTDYLTRIVSCHFVLVKVSGGNDTGIQEAFFAKRIWQSWTESTVTEHTSAEGFGGTNEEALIRGWTLTRVPAEEKAALDLRRESVLISNLQFRVKRHGVRPVMNVRFLPEENEIKRACQALLKYLINANMNNDPISRLSMNWKKFYDMRNKLPHERKESQKDQPFVFAVKVDVEDAYGSVIHEKMHNIILKKLKNAGLMIDSKVYVKAMKFFKRLANGKCVYKKRFLLEGMNIRPVDEKGESLPGWKVQWRKIGYLVSFLKRCITQHFVRDRGHLYHLAQGIVQGSIFSPFLWEIYLHDLVAVHLLPCLSDTSSELICGADDILFLTNSQEKAEWFLRRMLQGYKDYNVHINPIKISANLKNCVVKESCNIKFWGFSLDTMNGYAVGHFGGPPGRDLINSINLSILKNPWRSLESLPMFGNTKLCFLTLNPDFNGKRVVLCNIYRAALILAARFHAVTKVILKTLKLKARGGKNSAGKVSPENDTLHRSATMSDPSTSRSSGAKGCAKFCNNQTLLMEYLKTRVKYLARCVKKLELKYDFKGTPTREEIMWLAYTAFWIILGKNGGYYPEVLKRVTRLRKCMANRMLDENITGLQEIVNLCQR